MPLIETHRAYTEAWECDANVHLNVAFYIKRFQEAAAALHVLGGRAPSRLAARHVRFHREQRLDSAAIVRSGVIADGPAAGRVLHRMEETPGGALVATAIDDWDDVAGLPGAPEGDEAAAALPRGVAAGPEAASDARGRLAAGRAVVSDVTVADPAMFDAGGLFLTHHFIGRFSNGASHLWNFAGVDTAMLEADGLGRVAVETKLSVLAPVRPGAVLRLISWMADMDGKTALLAHQLEDWSDGTPLARGDVRALMMDLTARKAVPMPEAARARFAAIGP